jgi:hypothetical protein
MIKLKHHNVVFSAIHARMIGKIFAEFLTIFITHALIAGFHKLRPLLGGAEIPQTGLGPCAFSTPILSAILGSSHLVELAQRLSFTAWSGAGLFLHY